MMKDIKFTYSDFFSVQDKQLNLEGLLYNVDDEGSTLLHLAVDSGILPVRHTSPFIKAANMSYDGNMFKGFLDSLNG